MKLLTYCALGIILISPSCQRYHFKAGIVDITSASGTRTLHQKFHNGEVGKLGQGMIFRATLEDGSTMQIESHQPPTPEEK